MTLVAKVPCPFCYGKRYGDLRVTLEGEVVDICQTCFDRGEEAGDFDTPDDDERAERVQEYWYRTSGL